MHRGFILGLLFLTLEHVVDIGGLELSHSLSLGDVSLQDGVVPLQPLDERGMRSYEKVRHSMRIIGRAANAQVMAHAKDVPFIMLSISCFQVDP